MNLQLSQPHLKQAEMMMAAQQQAPVPKDAVITNTNPNKYQRGLRQVLDTDGQKNAPTKLKVDTLTPVIDVAANGFTHFGREGEANQELSDTVFGEFNTPMNGLAFNGTLLVGRDDTSIIQTNEDNFRPVLLSTKVDFNIATMPAAGFTFIPTWKLTKNNGGTFLSMMSDAFVINLVQTEYWSVANRGQLAYIPYDCNLVAELQSGDGTNFPVNSNVTFSVAGVAAKPGRTLPL